MMRRSNGDYAYTNDSQMGSMPLAVPDIVPLKRVEFSTTANSSSYYDHDFSGDMDDDDYIVTNTQAISQLIDDVAQLSDHEDEINAPETLGSSKNDDDADQSNDEDTYSVNIDPANPDSRSDPESQLDMCVTTTQDILRMELSLNQSQSDDEEVRSIHNEAEDTEEERDISYTQTSLDDLHADTSSPMIVPTQVLPEVDDTVSSSAYGYTPIAHTLAETSVIANDTSSDKHQPIEEENSLQPTERLEEDTYADLENDTYQNDESSLSHLDEELEAKNAELRVLEAEFSHAKLSQKLNQRQADVLAYESEINAIEVSAADIQKDDEDQGDIQAADEEVVSDADEASHEEPASAGEHLPYTQNTSMVISSLMKLSSDKPDLHLNQKQLSTVSIPGPVAVERTSPKLSLANPSPSRKHVTIIGEVAKTSSTSNPVAEISEPVSERRLFKRKYAGSSTLLSPSHSLESRDRTSTEFDPSSPMTIDSDYGTSVRSKPAAAAVGAARSRVIETSGEAEWTSQVNTTTAATASTSSCDSDSHSEEKEDRDDHDLPKHWTMKFIKSAKFSALWSDLKDSGWTWKPGKGIVSYYYIRPGKSTSPALCIAGRDYFTSEDEIMAFIRIGMQSRQPGKQSSSSTSYAAAAASAVKGKGSSSSKRASSSRRSIDSEDEDNDEDGEDQTWRDYDVETLEWAELWSFLKDEGWTYCYGTGVVEAWYIRPGYQMKSASPDLEKFGSKEAVRGYLAYQLQLEQAQAPSHLDFESQAYVWNKKLNAKHALKDWSLIDQRKPRRVKERRSDESADVEDDQGEPYVTTTPPTNHEVQPPDPDRRKTCLPPHIRQNPETSIASSSSSSSASKYVSRLLEGLSIIVTGFPDRKQIDQLIKQHKGSICEEFPLPSYFQQKSSTSSSTPQQYLVIGHPTGFRRPKNLLALTYGIPVVHELWLHRSIELKRREAYASYILPSGTSSLYTCSAFPPAPSIDISSCANMKLFDGVNFLNLAHISWKVVIESAGGRIIETTTQLLGDIESLRTNRVDNPIQYILVDSYAYREAIVREAISASTKATAAADDGLTVQGFRTVKSCLRRNAAIGKAVGNINIVSVEWLVNCIILSRIVSPYEKDVFQMPMEAKTKPTVWKVGAMKERYVLDDIIRYRQTAAATASRSSSSSKANANNKKRALSPAGDEDGYKYGRIVSFYQAPAAASTMQVMLMPLSIVNVNFSDLDDSNIPENMIELYNQRYRKQPESKSSKQKKRAKMSHEDLDDENELYQLKALTISEDVNTIDGLITISADEIVSKVILLERQSYRALEYAWEDPNIFCVSLEWEEKDNESVAYSSQSPSSRRFQRLASQDY
jgi:hypothetical protein